jgi:hypothetical protein
LELLEEYQCHLVEEPIPSLLTTLEPLGKTKIKAQKHKPYEIAATDVHMTLERFVHSNQTVSLTN